MRSLDRKLLRDSAHLKGQLIAVGLVVACGIASWVTMRSAHASLTLSQDAYYRAYRFADVFAHMRRAPQGLVPRIEEIPGVLTVQHRIVHEITVDVPGLDEPASARAVSLPEVHRPMLNDLHMTSGRWITPGRPDEAIMSESFATANGLSEGDSVGAIINGRWRRLTIVGTALSPESIYEVRGGDLLPDKRRFGTLWLSREALEAAFDMEGAFNSLTLTLAYGARIPEVLARIDDLIAPWGGTGAYDREEHPSHRFLADEIRSLEVGAAITPVIFLSVAAFLIHLVLSRLVQLQRDQIAILKAFGYESSRVGLHYLEMALFAIGLGSILGIAGGMWLGSSMTTLYGTLYNLPLLRYEAPPSLFATSVGISALAAAVGALSSVRAAIRLPPAEAMRPEAPPRFGKGMMERLRLQRFLPPAARIIARNLGRRGVKSLFSILGVGLAVSILVVGGFNFDAIDHLLRVQFGMAERENLGVTFILPRPWDAIHELERLPGVMRVEPFRTIPVRVEHGHRSKRVVLTGVPPGATLRRLLDERLDPVELPPEGVVLNSYLAKILEVSPGESVTISVLDESRPTVSMPLTATFDQMIGVAGYMEIGALNRLMREGRTVSGAYMLADPEHLPALLTRLKDTPAVAAVWRGGSTLETFRKTIGETMWIMNVFVIGFSCIIAIGVVYNSARIALSERGRELASLRVLGFTRGEVSFMLLGEQAILTLVAIPVGYLIGWWFCKLLADAYATELFRLPLIISSRTWSYSFLVIAAAGAISAWLVHRRIRQLDLVEVLKTRE